MVQTVIALPEELRLYAQGVVHVEPLNSEYAFADIKKMRRYRDAYLRNVLRVDPKKAWQLPDFQERLGAEIKRHAKQQILPALFGPQFDERLGEMPLFRHSFSAEYSRLQREYYSRAEAGRHFRKPLKYLLADAVRHVFNDSLQHGERLGELECACLGKLVYGY